jgi:hypothetical protein
MKWLNLHSVQVEPFGQPVLERASLLPPVLAFIAWGARIGPVYGYELRHVGPLNPQKNSCSNVY